MTYLEIPQAPQTFDVVLSRPWWCTGAEMGVNAQGVAIGNEAVFTTGPDGPPALLGMDLVRLGLERAPTARAAVSVMVELLETHGQGGPCSAERLHFSYDNSFLVADQTEAFVLETAGRRWATEEVTTPVRAISNALTIPGFAEAHSRRIRTFVTGGASRRQRTEAQAEAATSLLGLFATLRDHGDAGVHWSPVNGSLHAPCVHAGGLIASSQTTASMVVDLAASGRGWATASAAPCTSIFKPFTVDRPMELGPAVTNRFDPASRWWQHERLHRRAMADLDGFLRHIDPERSALEASFVADQVDPATAWATADALEARWHEELPSAVVETRPAFVRHQAAELAAAAGLPAD